MQKIWKGTIKTNYIWSIYVHSSETDKMKDQNLTWYGWNNLANLKPIWEVWSQGKKWKNQSRKHQEKLDQICKYICKYPSTSNFLVLNA